MIFKLIKLKIFVAFLYTRARTRDHPQQLPNNFDDNRYSLELLWNHLDRLFKERSLNHLQLSALILKSETQSDDGFFVLH